MLRNSFFKHHRGVALRLQHLRVSQKVVLCDAFLSRTRCYSSGRDSGDDYTLFQEGQVKPKGNTTKEDLAEVLITSPSQEQTNDFSTTVSGASPKLAFAIRKAPETVLEEFLLPHEREAQRKIAQRLQQEQRIKELKAVRQKELKKEQEKAISSTEHFSFKLSEQDGPHPAVESPPETSSHIKTFVRSEFSIRKNNPADEFLLPEEIGYRKRIQELNNTRNINASALSLPEETSDSKATTQPQTTISPKPTLKHTFSTCKPSVDELESLTLKEITRKVDNSQQATPVSSTTRNPSFNIRQPSPKELFFSKPAPKLDDLQKDTLASSTRKPSFSIRQPNPEELFLNESASKPDSLIGQKPGTSTPPPNSSLSKPIPQKPIFAFRSSVSEDEFLSPQEIAARQKLAKAALRTQTGQFTGTLPQNMNSSVPKSPLGNLGGKTAEQPRRDPRDILSKFSALLHSSKSKMQQYGQEKRPVNFRNEGGVWGALRKKEGLSDTRTRRTSTEVFHNNERSPKEPSQSNRTTTESELADKTPEANPMQALGIELDMKEQDEDEKLSADKPKNDNEPVLVKSDHLANEDDDSPKKKRKDKKRKEKGLGWASRWDDDNLDGKDWSMEDELKLQRKREEKAARKAAKEAEKQAQKEASASRTKSIFIPEYISVSALAQSLKIKNQEFLEILEEFGFEDMTEDTIMTGETAALVAQEFGLEAIVDDGKARDLRPRPRPEDLTNLPPRPPVVTIMGHVDHGKTTLLDYIRKSSIAAQEHGGITQHIGAFIVKLQSGKQITFLDTPGHAAFLSMRQRGANATDIVILVVAADDSVMPQTLEALKHARAAKVPIIVAITKVDKPEAHLDKVKLDLSSNGVDIEEYGGEIQVVPVSGKTGLGMDVLEENIITLAEIMDLRAETDGMAEGWILEADVKPLGKTATVLVKRGTLRVGDSIVAGKTWARIRSLRDENGRGLSEAPPGTPVEVLGWRDLPQSGDHMLQAPDEHRARVAVDYRIEMAEREAGQAQLAEQERLRKEAAAEEELKKEFEKAGEDNAPPAEKGPKIVNFIVRADVVGSVEAVSAIIQGIGSHEVQSQMLREAAGNVTESDVEYASISKSIIISFNNPPLGHIKRLAYDAGVEIIEHSVIYTVADDVRRIMSRKLDDTITYKVTGEAEVKQIFSINVEKRIYKNIAGCTVRNGVIKRNDYVKVMRNNEEVFFGKMKELKQAKTSVMEMKVGTDCGIRLVDFEDFKPGDIIQTCQEVRTKRVL